MFIILSKILPPFVYPLGITCVLLLVAMVCKKTKIRTALIFFALALLWISSAPAVAESLARSLEWRYLPPNPIPSAEVIVVLGGGTDPAVHPRLGVEVNSAGDRVLAAAQLYQQGKAQHILLSGGSISWLSDEQSNPAQEMATLLKMVGVPPEVLWLEEESQNTYENAIFSKELLDEKGISKIILVTSAMHMPRAVGLFEKQGIEVIPVPVDYSITSAENASSPIAKALKIIPSASGLSMTTNALKEYLGLLTYRLQGWL